MLLEHLTLNISGPVRHETLDGKDHLVVPTVMIVEGVLNGSQGPKYYPADELESSVYGWNHKPVVVYHPKEGSACDPAILNTRKVGLVLNTSWEAPKLRNETWLDILACNRVDKRIIETLENNKTVEVSTGLYTTNEKSEGEFNGKKYTSIARNYRPDHLAILPDQIGACSIADGAGLLQLNSQAIRDGKLDSQMLAAIMGKTGLRPVLTENAKSYQEITSEIYSQLQARLGWNCYVDAVFDTFFIYCYDGDTYKLSYTSSDKEVSIGQDPVEVYRKVSYVTVNGSAVQTVNNQKADVKETLSMGKKAAIDALIANGGYEEADRTILEGFSEDKVVAMAAKLAPVVKNEETPAPKPSPFKEPTKNEETVAVPKKDWDRVLALANNAEQQETSAKSAFADLLVANTKCPFTKDHLMKQDMATLQGIAQMIGVGAAPVANYSGAVGFVPQAPVVNKGSEEDEAPYVRPTMNFASN